MVTRSPSRGPGRDAPGRLVAEDQRRRAAGVVAVIGVHVGAADADGLDPDEHFAGVRHRIGLVAEVQAVGAGVDERLHGATPHFAVKPPSTASVWPVT